MYIFALQLFIKVVVYNILNTLNYGVSNMIKIFIDGKEGTTGLKIYERFINRKDVEVLVLEEDKRKDPAYRKEFINKSDITFLCLPDDAATEAAEFAENPNVKIIDASTAHRTAEGWCYGFPELSEAHRTRIEKCTRIAVPGCHASGFVAIIYPLVKTGLLSPDYSVSCFSLTGYSGGGKKMIAEYESSQRSVYLDSPRLYGISQMHKHLKEMKFVTGISKEPVFSPVVADFYSGMEVSVPLFKESTGLTAKEIHQFYCDYYSHAKMVSVASYNGESEFSNKFIPANYMSGRNDMKIFVTGNDERITVSALFDNLGKGASGAAVQCMNIACGAEETLGLI